MRQKVSTDHSFKKRKKIESIVSSSKAYSFQNNKYCFIDEDRIPKASTGGGLLGFIQEVLKKSGKLYSILVYFLSPVQSSKIFRSTMKDILMSHGEDQVIVNVGSGPNYLKGRRDMVNVDVFPFDQVDIVSDATDLPFVDESVDVIINIAMLEHAYNPDKIVSEMHRVLKPDGTIFCYLPFIVPYHAAPDDFFRWTISGCRKQFSRFKHIEIFIGGGPTSGMLWIFQEWLATLCSFGSKTVHDILLLTIMAAMAPLKLIDFLIERFPSAKNIASGFGIYGRK